MKNIILLLSLLITTTIQAEFLPSNETSKFEALLNYYNQADVATPEQLEGAKLGNEYSFDDPNTVQGAYVYCRDFNSQKEHGPLFEDNKFRCYPGHYDKEWGIDTGKIRKQAFAAFEKYNYELQTVGQYEDTCVEFPDAPNQNKLLVACFRIFQSYVVYVVKAIEEGNERVSLLKAGYLYTHFTK